MVLPGRRYVFSAASRRPRCPKGSRARTQWARGIEPITDFLGNTAFHKESGAKNGALSDVEELLDLWVVLSDDQRAEVLGLARRLGGFGTITSGGVTADAHQ